MELTFLTSTSMISVNLKIEQHNIFSIKCVEFRRKHGMDQNDSGRRSGK